MNERHPVSGRESLDRRSLASVCLLTTSLESSVTTRDTNLLGSTSPAFEEDNIIPGPWLVFRNSHDSITRLSRN